jgi:hypothetical protein
MKRINRIMIWDVRTFTSIDYVLAFLNNQSIEVSSTAKITENEYGYKVIYLKEE